MGSQAGLLRPEEEAVEANFQVGIRGTPWFNNFVSEYGEEPDLRPVNEDPALGPNYDYRAAWNAGIRPEPDPYDNNKYHWPSSLEDGTMLKTPNHPTAWKEYFMRKHGVNPDLLAPELVDQMRMQEGLINGR